MTEQIKCELCGEPMPSGEEMFKTHGYSGNCPKPPLPLPLRPSMNHDYLLQFFTYQHLPPHLQAISMHFSELAHRLIADVPSNPERTVALRKLLEAKDCAVRAVLFKSET